MRRCLLGRLPDVGQAAEGNYRIMLLLFLLGIAVLLNFVGPVHLSVKGKLISSTLLLLKNVSGPYPKKSSTTSVTLAFPHLFALMVL